MADRDDRRQSAPASGMRAEHDDHRTRTDAGWPQDTRDRSDPEQAPPGTGGEAADALEEETAVRRAIDDDTGTAAFADGDEDDRGPLAPGFREPSDSDSEA
ncbi:hypothetical protein [Streptomyces leeuwenhoekii]|uniref:Uncharacterized protein n=1 Tax=Streptomyces leeuwenhoekii TaxID=1437453 RepID=A0A0F7VRK9_STRLW|nr:hypothetical protein [Streptomyces leeuwenhoekii]CQR61233.1 Hypothetical Protein sle_17710 [Streptomyces leeuwenhoekii]